MAAAIPVVIAAVSAGSAIATAGGVVAAMSTFAGFASVAGAVLTGIGALTKKTSLARFGALLSLGGGLANAFSSAGGAAQGAGGAAAEAGAEAATTAFDTGAGGFFGSQAAIDNALGSAGVAGGNSLSTAPLALDGAAAGVANAATDGGSSLFATGQSRFADMFGSNPSAASAAAPPEATPSWMGEGDTITPYQRAQQAGGAPVDPNAAVDPTKFANDRLQKAASEMTTDQLKALLKNRADKAGTALSGVGQFLKDNKELVSMGGNALASMYGPDAELLDLRKSIIDRQRRNLNTPVVLQGGM